MNGVNHLKGGTSLVIEHTAQRSLGDSGELREDFLSHVIRLHDFLDSIFHTRQIVLNEALGPKKGLSPTICKVKT